SRHTSWPRDWSSEVCSSDLTFWRSVPAGHFRRFGFDLAYARPGQTARSWLAELDRALDFAGEHLSVYQLTIEANTAFEGAHRRGEFAMPGQETGAALFEITQARLEEAGLPP